MMRLLNLFLLLISSYSFAQKNDVFRIDSIPQQGILLDKAWKWHAGDNPDFAKADFDDSKWEGIDPTNDVHDRLPQISKPSGISWFRLHLTISKNVLKNQLALRISQSGASEIYENGVLLRKLGLISPNPNKIRAFDPLNKPITFNSTKDTNIVLAIRYTLQPNVRYTSILSRQNPALSIELNDSERAFIKYSNYEIRASDSRIIRRGVFFIVFLLCLSYYLYDPKQKANLYFSFYAMCNIIFDILVTTPNTVDKIYYYYNIGIIAQLLGAFILLTAFCFLLNQKRIWIYWSLFAFVNITIFLNVVYYHFGEIIFNALVVNLINIEIVRIAIKSIKTKKRGAWIITIGGICYAVFYVAFISGLPFAFNYWLRPFMGTIYTVGDALYNLALLSIPATVCVYVGLDIANTNRTLRQKLVELNVLSSEKQQILSTQNETLEKQVKERTAELVASQAQLIQKEKLASLGELTAGIAHEIQNPLNFVNNFSEVSVELANELQEALRQRGIEANSEEGELVSDLIQNQERIHHHGKRASSIVKGMLEHSRTSTGVKELTDINALADEYLRLSYHGLRAKDPSFNADYKTEFETPISKIMVVPQDIGRVLLNLYNNAFYAVHQRALNVGEVEPLNLPNVKTYTPSVLVSTKYVDNQIIISVKDNGSGIPDNIKAKIFHPFFTTKPTGEGTGLGLSLAYDIVTKGHGGSLSVQSDTYGSNFILALPKTS